MKTDQSQSFSIAGVLLFVLCCAPCVVAADETETAIRASVDSYVKAFNRGDAAAVAGFWAENAVYQPAIGMALVDREAIQQAFAKTLSPGTGAQLAVTINTLRPINAEAASAQGTAEVMRPGAPPKQTSFHSIHVKDDGQWVIHFLQETALPAASTASAAEELKPLEWMTGTWIDRGKNSTVHYVCDWVAEGNFLRRSFAVSTGDGVERSGTELIRWDPAAKIIRSWTYDSKGAATEAEWTAGASGVWNVTAVGTVSGEEGQRSAVQIIRKVGDNTYTWQSVGRHGPGGALLPNTDPVAVVKIP